MGMQEIEQARNEREQYARMLRTAADLVDDGVMAVTDFQIDKEHAPMRYMILESGQLASMATCDQVRVSIQIDREVGRMFQVCPSTGEGTTE